MLLLPGILLILYPVIAHGALKDGLTYWIPTFVTEAFAVPVVIAPLVSMTLPIINLLGAAAAQIVYQRVVRNEFFASALFFALSAFLLAVMRLFAMNSLVFFLALLSIVTSSMLAVNTLLISVLPLRMGPYGRVATLSGLLNATAYGGSAIASAAIGFIVEGRGWNAAIEPWIILSVLATFVCLIGRRVRMAPKYGSSIPP